VVSAKELAPADRERLQGHVQKILQKGDFGREQLLREVQQTVNSSSRIQMKPRSNFLRKPAPRFTFHVSRITFHIL